MADIERRLLDADIISTQQQLIPPQSDFSRYDFVRYAPSQAVSSWLPNGTLTIVAPKNPDTLICWDESRILLNYQLGVKCVQQYMIPGAVGPPVLPAVTYPANTFLPLNILTSFCPRENFHDTLITQCLVSWGSTPFNSLFKCDNAAQVYASGIYRALKAERGVHGGAHPEYDPEDAGGYTGYALFYGDCEDAKDLDLPMDICNPDIWNNGVAGAISADRVWGVQGGTVQNANACHRHYSWFEPREAQSSSPNVFHVLWHPFVPHWFIKKKMPHNNDIKIDLQRASSFTCSYQGNPGDDVYTQGGTATPTVLPPNANQFYYDIQYNYVELWLSTYKLRNETGLMLQEILLSDAVVYSANKLSVFNNPLTMGQSYVQFTLQPGSKPDVCLVAFVRQQQLTGMYQTYPNGVTSGPQFSSPSGINIMPSLASAPRAIGPTNATGYEAPDIFVVAPNVKNIYTYVSGLQYPSIQYFPDVAPVSQSTTALTPGVVSVGYPPISPATQLAQYDRAYQDFAKQMMGCGWGAALRVITKDVWRTYLRIYAFDYTANHTWFAHSGTEITDRQNVQVNAELAYPSGLTGTANGFSIPTNSNLFTMISICITNQQPITLKANGSLTVYE